MSTPVTSGSECFRTSDEEEDDEKGGGYFGGGVVGASSSGGVLVPTSAAHTAAITTPFMMGLGPLPAAGVAGAGADGGEGEMGGYLADEEGGGVQLNGLPAAGESGGWEFVEEGLGYEDHEHGGMGFEQAFDMDGDDEGEFLG